MRHPEHAGPISRPLCSARLGWSGPPNRRWPLPEQPAASRAGAVGAAARSSHRIREARPASRTPLPARGGKRKS